MKAVAIKDVKYDEFFTLIPTEEPKESQVWVRGDYNRSTKKYEAHKFSDIGHFHEFGRNKKVYIDFIFLRYDTD